MTRNKMSHSHYFRTWNDGVNKLFNDDVTGALEDFKSIDSPTARIYFNMALAHKRLQKDELALQELSEALRLDPNFAVAYFLKGAYLFEQERYQEALDAFVEGRKKLFGRQFINYHQLGMMFVLSDEDLEKNIAVCEQKLNPASESAVQLVTLPSGMAFHPPKNKVESLEKIDFLGKTTVILAHDRRDSFTGFTGTKLKDSQPVGVHSAPPSPKPAKQSSLHSGVSVVKLSVRSFASSVASQLPLQAVQDIRATGPVPAAPTDNKLRFMKDRLVVLPWNENTVKDIFQQNNISGRVN